MTTVQPSAAERASFHSMQEGTAQDWAIIASRIQHDAAALPDRVLAHLRLLDGDGGFAVDRLTHSLQTATRAERAGRGDEYVLAALLHDIGDTVAMYNHADIGAAILKPFVAPELHWMVEHHTEFQGYYYFHHLGFDREARERYRDNPNFAFTEEFCAAYDQTSFDPDYATEPLEHFEPLVRQLLAAPRKQG